MVCTATAQPEVRSFGEVLDIGFSLHAVPTYYSVSEYFMQESGNAEFSFQSLEIWKLSAALIGEECRVGIKARVFLEAWKSRLGSCKWRH